MSLLKNSERPVLLIGHRGVGKSTLSKKLFGLDLDEEIVKRSGEDIQKIFSRPNGEKVFRQLERETLGQLIRSATAARVIAVGAGFEGPMPREARVIWIRRTTDANGRVFLDRPRLDKNGSPYEEYLKRFPIREGRFRDWAQEQVFLPEGDIPGVENLITGDVNFRQAADLSLLAENFKDWRVFWQRRQSWKIRRFEIRDDLLSPEQIEKALKDIPSDRVLFSCRTQSHEFDLNLSVDWPMELGSPKRRVFILSVHEGGIASAQTLERWSHQASILKLAVEVNSFHELMEGHRWWCQDPARRAFLPRSTNGRWRWYRSLFGPRMPLHFIRESEGSGLDQPFLWQAHFQTPFTGNFAAVLGDPVEHSLSPSEHRDFFARRKMPFVTVPVAEEELEQALPVLLDLGLKCAAVTAPLKTVLARKIKAENLSPISRELQSVNTIYIDKEGCIRGDNTDVVALAKIKEELVHNEASVWLWGGGGVKSSIRMVWPCAREFSAREGLPSNKEEELSPDLLIWAVGRSRTFRWPPSDVRPGCVLDLNYGADSPGLEWAVSNGFCYQSGLRMFKLQAEAQQQYWCVCEGE